MKIIESPSEMLKITREVRCEGKSIGVVLTMGALHNGHISLIRKCREENDIAIVSIYVNPMQFAKGEDYDRYPRQPALDQKICMAEKVDYLFLPSVGPIYPKGFDTFINQNHYVKCLCGPFRKGHFKGVMTVVSKFFNIIQPDVAYFGQKDYQQYKIIERMTIDLNFPVKIKMLPTVREEDGLAISSRNAYLGPKQRKQATSIYQTLLYAKNNIAKGVVRTAKLKKEMIKMLKDQKGIKVDYVEIVNPDSLEPLNEVKSTALVAVAVRLGNTRLIDNILVSRR